MADFKKLQIIGFKSTAFSDSEKVGTFTVMFNPDNYSDKLEIEYNEPKSKGTSPGPADFKGIKPRELSLEFTIDGTNVTGPIEISQEQQAKVAEGDNSKVDVTKKIAEFKSICTDFQGATHHVYPLQIVWGDLSFNCVLKTVDIKYTLFDREGKPLRAKMNCTFAQTLSDKEREALEKKSSPDLTHIRTVLAGDTLPLMAHRIYGDSKYYLEVARVNGLKDFRKLSPGQELVFPPIDKTQN